jgi:hypothetical protein
MRLILPILFLLSVSDNAFAQPEMEERSLIDGRVTITMPAELQPMSEEAMLAKYSAARKPTVAFSDENAAVSVALLHMDAPLTPEQIPQAYEMLKQSMEATYPSARWNRSEIVERDGADHIVFDLWVPAQRGETRNLMAFTVLDGRLLSINFNAASYLAEEWASMGERIIESVRIRG